MQMEKTVFKRAYKLGRFCLLHSDKNLGELSYENYSVMECRENFVLMMLCRFVISQVMTEL